MKKGSKMTSEQIERIKIGRQKFFANGGTSGMKGKHHSEEVRRKISCAKKGRPGHWMGKSFSIEHRENISIARLGKKPANFTGKGAHYLRGLAKIRDNYTCKECGWYEPLIMEVDHIKPRWSYPELTRDLNNLVTLCPNCHRRKSLLNKEIGGAARWHQKVPQVILLKT